MCGSGQKGSVVRLEDMTRLMHLRLDVAGLRSIQHMPVSERCTVAVTLLNPHFSWDQGARYTAWGLHAFTFLNSLSIKWDASHWHAALLGEMLEAVPKSVRSLDITCPQSCEVFSPNIRVSRRRALVALRLRISGLMYNQKPLRLRLPDSMQRLTLQAWGVHVVLDGHNGAFQSMTDMHVEAVSIDPTPWGSPRLNVQERWQVSARVPDASEIYGGTGGQSVQVAHMGQWPPSFPGYEGPDVPEARACCYWPCECGACDICRRADFWPVALGSG